MSNTFEKQARLWYQKKVASIPFEINKEDTLEQQARQAFKLRNFYRSEARKKMRNKKEVKRLERDFPNYTFEKLLSKKLLKKGKKSMDEAYLDIIRTATKTNEEIDAMLTKPKIINTILKLGKKGNIHNKIRSMG